MRLDRVAAELFDDFSRGQLQKWIRSGELTLDGFEGKVTQRVGGSETLRIDAVAMPTETVQPQPIPLNVLHADADLLVIDKAAGMVVHPAAGNPDGTLQNGLLHYDERLAALPRSGIVHRLDKDTTGVMVVARSLRAHSSLVEQLQSRTMKRQYRAVALDDVAGDGTVEAPIGRHPVDRKRMAVVAGGRPAVTHYRVLRRFGAATELEVSLETGRTHQIRVHMAHIGHPLVGDPVYGRRRVDPGPAASAMQAFPRQALHARRLRLVHPGTGEAVRFEAPLPDDLAGLLDELERTEP
ncbi:MAG: RluA family pseudouridine synthase [Gammaproteobacteria bacterium]|nr:RluA family pseudouridine synthase [Gammaproteobacteria bacterium]